MYGVRSPTSKGVSSESACDWERSRLIRPPILPDCLLRPRWPGTYGGDEALVAEPGGDDLGLNLAGVRSFHAATIFRTEVKGDRGDVCGRRSGDAVGVTVAGAVAVNVFVIGENVSVYVLVNVPGLWNVPAVLVRVSVQVSVADRDVRPRSRGDIRLEIGCEVDETDDADEPECHLVGEDDLEEYPVAVSPRPVPYPAVLLIMGVDWLAEGR